TKKPGYKPTRLNRNIGTKSAGYGQDNKLVIPWAWADNRIFYERLVDPVVVEIQVGSVSKHVIIEPTIKGFIHACTVDDIQRLLELIPVEHINDITAFVLRQPKRKEQILSSVWGRLVYSSDVCGFSGPTVYLEAQNFEQPLKWSKSLTPEGAKELERLREDGHVVVTDKRQHIINSTLDTIRNTQLYRTLPHEIGHYVDYLTKVEEPSKDNFDLWSVLNDKYHSRPSQERESFAHRYADEFRKQQIAIGAIPFERVFDDAKMRAVGLGPAWFGRLG
ncbi:MAG: hypothetical protein AAF063_28735, partial [Cyanobacteria bacterium J06643_5]